MQWCTTNRPLDSDNTENESKISVRYMNVFLFLLRYFSQSSSSSFNIAIGLLYIVICRHRSSIGFVLLSFDEISISTYGFVRGLLTKWLSVFERWRFALLRTVFPWSECFHPFYFISFFDFVDLNKLKMWMKLGWIWLQTIKYTIFWKVDWFENNFGRSVQP